MNELTKDFLKYNGKSMPVGILLATLFGPIGLAYTSGVLAVVMTIFVIASIPTGFGPVILWAVCILMQIGNVSEHNQVAKVD
jgi:type IV secretory pathway TrbD component